MNGIYRSLNILKLNKNNINLFITDLKQIKTNYKFNIYAEYLV